MKARNPVVPLNVPVTSFQGPFRFLSNFYPAPVQFQRQTWASVEHAYQSAKSEDPAYKLSIWTCEKAADAKRKGTPASFATNGWELVKDWDDLKEGIMLKLLRQKFQSHLDLRDRLLLTHPCELIEGNWWGDTYWGVCHGEGENKLGILLMQVRSELLR